MGEAGVTGLDRFWPSEASEKWSSSPSEDTAITSQPGFRRDCGGLVLRSCAPGSTNSILFLGTSKLVLDSDLECDPDIVDALCAMFGSL